MAIIFDYGIESSTSKSILIFTRRFENDPHGIYIFEQAETVHHVKFGGFASAYAEGFDEIAHLSENRCTYLLIVQRVIGDCRTALNSIMTEVGESEVGTGANLAQYREFVRTPEIEVKEFIDHDDGIAEGDVSNGSISVTNGRANTVTFGLKSVST